MLIGHKHKIAVIMGDGIGKEVAPEGTRVLDVAGKRFGFELVWTPFPWSCGIGELNQRVSERQFRRRWHAPH